MAKNKMTKELEKQQLHRDYGKAIELLNNDDERANDYILKVLMSNEKKLVDGLKFELGKIEFRKGNFDKAKSNLKPLIGTNYDQSARLCLAKIECKLGNIDLARKYYIDLINEYNNKFALYEMGIIERNAGNYELAKVYLKKRLGGDIDNIILESLMVVCIYQKEYLECLKYLNEYVSNYQISSRICYIISILEKELNIFFPEELHCYSKYRIVQKYNYNENDVINHIATHLDYDEAKPEHTVFCKDVDIKKLFYEVKNNLNYYYCEIQELIKNYTVFYPNIGDNGENYLRIITHLNDEIITMYPIKEVTDELDEEYVDEYVKKIGG